MTNKAPFCTSLRLIRIVFCRLLNKAISMALWTKVITCDKAGFKSRFCQVHKAGKIGVNQRNLCPRYPWLINDLRSTKVYVRKIHLFMQNEPNFRKSQKNVNDCNIRDYEQMDTWSIRKNEPKTNPISAQKTTQRTQIESNFSQ